MGIGSSTAVGQEIGYWFNSKFIYEKDRVVLDSGIASGKYIRYPDNEPAPEGWEFLAKLYNESTKIARKQSGLKLWWASHKDKVISKIAATGKISAQAATNAASIALPALISAGAAAAKQALINEGLSSDLANVIVDSLNSQMNVGAISNSIDVSRKGGSELSLGGLSDRAYMGAVEHYFPTGAYSGGFDADAAFAEGGCGCQDRFIGADELDSTSVRDYANSTNSKTKDKIIEDILVVASKIGLKITGDKREDKIKSLLSQIPSADKFKQDPEVHKKTCIGIAGAINKIHGNTVINTSLPAEVVCQQVSEIISSLEAGMHTEFLSVYNDVRKILKNLHIIKNALKDDHLAIVERVKASDDALLPQQLTTLDDLHNILLEEIDRQISMLQNLLNITLFPTEKELANLIKDKKDIHGYIEKIDVKLGSDKFGKVISDILKGLGLTANFALLIERALKTVGITLDDYAKGTNVTKLRERITQNLMGKNLTDEQLHEYLEAADLLYRNFYRNQDIASKIEQSHKSGSSENMYAGYSGGDDKYQKTVMDKRIADRKKLRNLIFNTFYKQLNDIFDRFVGSIDALSMKVGDEIPLSDQLDGFRQVLQRINESLVRNKNIYYALIGYYNDAMSKSKKDTLLGELKMVNSFIEAILDMPMYKASSQYFTSVQSHIKSMIDLIEKFSDEIAAKFGRGEDITGGCDYEGGVDGPAFPGSGLEVEPKITYKPTKSINDAIRQFDYKYKTAQIRINMNRTSKELSHYSEKYEKIIANSIADILEKEKKVYEKLRKELSDVDKFKAAAPVPVNAAEYGGYIDANVEGFKSAEDVRNERETALKILDAQWETKKKFWATIEAADTYMKVFTDGLVKNPSDIKEIKSMLDSIDVIHDWYNNATGNDLTAVFENFPSFTSGAGLTSAGAASAHELLMPPKEYRSKDLRSHYYKRIADNLGKTLGGTLLVNTNDVITAAYPGNPYVVTLPSYGEQARNQVKKTFGGLAILKNLLSIFVNVGGKFGGEELRKKVFMTPAQMYNNLVDYLQASSFAQGWAVGVPSDLAEGPLDQSFWDSNKMAVEYNYVDGTLGEYTDLAALAGYTHGESALYDSAHNHVHVGVTPTRNTNIPHGVALANNSAAIQLFKKRWGVWMRSVNENLRTMEGFGFKNEDDYFVIMMKSIAAKIFTVTGMYDVLDRPMEFNGLSAIRMITGGSGEVPKVDDGAVALYFRLPLLAQFYRTIFGFDGDESTFKDYDKIPRRNQMLKISMVPDVDGTFAGLIRLIFRKTKYVSNNAYSDEDIKEIIRECNLIYQRMQSKYPQNTVMETYHEFVAEINRRYGIISKDERNDYEREFGYRYGYSDLTSASGPVMDRYAEAPETEYAILPGEGEDEVERPSSAQKLLGEKFESSTRERMFTITTQHRDLVYRFRCAIDKYFENPDEEFTFNQAIKATQLKLKKETRDDERFKIVSSLIRGVDVYSKIDGMKYVLFHETVVSGLNTLSAVHTLLSRFKRRAQLISLKDIQDQIWEYLGSPGAKSFDGLRAHIITYIADALAISEEDSRLEELVSNLFGIFEAQQKHGGHSSDPNTLFAIKATNGVSAGTDANETFVHRWVGEFHVVPSSPAATHPSNKCRVDRDYVITLVDGSLAGGVAAPVLSAAPATDVRALPGAFETSLFTVIAGFGVNQLRKAYNDPSDKGSEAKLAAETFMRFIFGRDYVMKELLETTFGFGHDFQGLVEVRIDDGKLYMSYSGLKTLVEEMFQHVSYFIDLLRPHVNVETLAKYTEKATPGSYYWLQEQLMEKIIIGRPRADVKLPGEADLRRGYVNLDELIQKLTYTYNELTREYITDGTSLVPSNLRATSVAKRAAKPNKNSFDKVFAELIFYDASKPQSGLIKSLEASTAETEARVVDFLHDPYEALHFAGGVGSKVLDTRYAARFYQLYSWKNELTFNRSAMFAFNQLVAKYIQNFYDPVSGKIYAGILNQFATGAFNRAVADQTFTYPDTVPGLYVKFGTGGEMKIPSTQIIESTILGHEAIEDVLTLKSLVLNYTTYGTAPNMPQIQRAGLLNLHHPDLLNIASLTTTAGGPALTPKVYAWLVIHAIGMAIADIFAKFDAAAVLANATIAGGGIATTNALLTGDIMDLLRLPSVTALAAGPARPATYGAARQLFGATVNASPTISQIMNKLLAGGIDDVVARINSVLTHADARGAAGTEFTPAAGALVNVFGTGLGAGGVAPFNVAASDYAGFKLMKIIANYLVRPDKYPSANINAAGILAVALRLFPFRDDVFGRNPEELAYRAELASSLIIRAAIAVQNAHAVAAVGPFVAADFLESFGKALEGISNSVNGVKSTYIPAPDNNPMILMKYDDALIANTDKFFAADIIHPVVDTNYIVAARRERLGNGLPTDSWRKLGSNVGKGGNHGAGGDDDLTNIQKFGKRMDPDAEHVLFTSISIVLKNLITSKNSNNQTSVYIIDNVADIPIYMKEKMRANLPAFKNLFKELSTRCEFLKKFLSRPEMDVTRRWTSHGVGIGRDYKINVVPKSNPWPYVLAPCEEATGEMSSGAVKNRWTGILDSIVRGCAAINTSCEQVLREIGDDPKYLELYQNSMKDYKAQYQMDPFMPLSTTLAIVKNITNENYLDFFPIHNLGEDQFKFMYGTRSLLQQPQVQPLMENAPGFGHIVDGFNLIIDSKFSADKSRADSFFKTFVKLARYIYEARHVKGLLTPHILVKAGAVMSLPEDYDLTQPSSTFLHIDGMFTRDDMVVTDKVRGTLVDRPHGANVNYSIYDANGPVVLTNKSDVSIVVDGSNKNRNAYKLMDSEIRPYPIPVYSIGKSLSETIKLTESSFKEDKIKELVEYMISSHGKRNSLEIQNIIDLNIVPINVHALMREIPLANLYNYAYTFDRLIIELYYGLRNENARQLIHDLCADEPNKSGLKRITSAKDMLVALLLQPYMNVWKASNSDEAERITDDVNYYEKFVKPMLVGVASNGELGRPKFLSDQIYNKTIFGQVYEDESEYNEMGPSAASIARVQISKEIAANAYGSILFSILISLNSNYKFQGMLVNPLTSANASALKQYCVAVARYLLENTTIKLVDLYQRIYKRFLSPGSGFVELLNMRAGGNDDGGKLIAAVTSLVGRLTVGHMVALVMDISRSGPATIGPHIDDMLQALGALQAFHNVANADWAGMRVVTDPVAARAAVTPTIDADVAEWIIVDSMYSNTLGYPNKANFGGAPHNWLGYVVFNTPGGVAGVANYRMSPVAERINRSSAGYIIAGLKDFKLPNVVVSVDRPSIPVGRDLYGDVVKALSLNTNPTRELSSKPVTPTSLHWLDISSNAVDYDDESTHSGPGVGHQRKPRGDNDNVLDSKQVHSVDVSELRDVLMIVGRLRFDTVFIRNLIFITNLYRSVRVKLQRDLVYSKDVILRSVPITRPQLTEFYGNQVDLAPDDYRRSQMYKRYSY